MLQPQLPRRVEEPLEYREIVHPRTESPSSHRCDRCDRECYEGEITITLHPSCPPACVQCRNARCRDQEPHMGTDRSGEAVPHRRSKQNRCRRGSHDPFEPRLVLGSRGSRTLVHKTLRNSASRMVCVSWACWTPRARQATLIRPNTTRYQSKDRVEEREGPGRCGGTIPRHAAHAYHGACRKWCWGSNHHGYRWSRLTPDARSIQPHSHGSEA